MLKGIFVFHLILLTSCANFQNSEDAAVASATSDASKLVLHCQTGENETLTKFDFHVSGDEGRLVSNDLGIQSGALATRTKDVGTNAQFEGEDEFGSLYWLRFPASVLLKKQVSVKAALKMTILEREADKPDAFENFQCQVENLAPGTPSTASTSKKRPVYECGYSEPRPWRDTDDLDAKTKETIEVTLDTSDILESLQAEQIVVAAHHLHEIELDDGVVFNSDSTNLSRAFDTADNGEISILKALGMVNGGQSRNYDVVHYYAGNTEVGVAFEENSLKIIAQLGDGQVEGCVEKS